jgi:hypothetical protein
VLVALLALAGCGGPPMPSFAAEDTLAPRTFDVPREPAPASTAEPPPVDVEKPPPAPPPARDPRAARIAKMLAGKAVDDPPRGLADLLDHHAKRVAADVAAFDQKAGKAMLEWSAREVPQAPGETVFYPFAGPDFITAHRLYPRASRYVLVALQEPGALPSIDTLPRAEARKALAVYERVIASFTRRGFFLTAAMGRGFVAADELGVAGALIAFAEIEGFDVLSVEPRAISTSGELVPADDGPALHVALVRRDGGESVSLDYVKLDLSDGFLKQHAPSRRFVEREAKSRVLVKAASHLMQQMGFDMIRDALIDRAETILEDETGVAYSALTPRFDVTLFGRFDRVNTLFSGRPQRALTEAYATRDDVRELPFPIGYRKNKGSCLQLAKRK